MKVVSLCLLLTLAADCSTIASHEGATAQTQNKVSVSDKGNIFTVQSQGYVSKASELAQKLQSSDAVKRGQAKREIIDLTRHSSDSREQVIQELLEIMKKSNTRLRLESEAHSDAWGFAAESLGNLKATEALDTLIDCINCSTNDLGGLSYDNYPALKAIIRMGSDAIPKLTEALSNSQPETRRYAALALGEIGGGKAKKALKDALPLEHDSYVLIAIKIGLRES